MLLDQSCAAEILSLDGLKGTAAKAERIPLVTTGSLKQIVLLLSFVFQITGRNFH